MNQIKVMAVVALGVALHSHGSHALARLEHTAPPDDSGRAIVWDREECLEFYAPSAPAGSCNVPGATVMHNACWLDWTAPAPAAYGHVVIEPIVPFHFIAAAYRSTPGGLTEIACDQSDSRAVLDFSLAEGGHILIQIGVYGLVDGGECVRIQLGTDLANESCGSARDVAPYLWSALPSFQHASPGAPPGLCNTPGVTLMQSDVWYRWSTPESLTAIISGPPLVQVWQGDCNALVPIACGRPGPYGSITFDAVAGAEYLIQAGTLGTAPGTSASSIRGQLGVASDTCPNMRIITANERTPINLAAATPSPTDPVIPCLNSAQVAPATAWYSFVARASTAKISVTRQDGQTPASVALARVVGECGQTTTVSCDTGSGLGGAPKLTLLGLTQGEQVRLIVAVSGEEARTSYDFWVESPIGCARCPSGGVWENEICGTQTNNGCAATPQWFGSIACGSTVCGKLPIPLTAAERTIPRDYDEWEFVIDTPSRVQWCAASQSPCALGIARNGCGGNSFRSATTDCNTHCVTWDLPPGAYIVYLVGNYLTSATCERLGDYWAKLTVSQLCPGDLDDDLRVGTSDLTALLLRYGSPVDSCSRYDLARDGLINSADLVLLLLSYGRTCPAFSPES